mgnify:CR=1 FL=1
MSTKVGITCPNCKGKLVVEYRTVGLGHATTDEALAIDRAIRSHKCNARKQAETGGENTTG